MSEEVKAAAERLRLHETSVRNNDLCKSPYAGVWEVGEGRTINWSMRAQDAIAVALPLLDEVKIDIEWCRQIGLCDWQNTLDLFFEKDGTCSCRWHGWELPKLKGRGDVRRLCLSLGIPLKEPTNGND